MRVAIILACYNRMEKTQQCLETLEKIRIKESDFDFEYWICDDNSTDGTQNMIKELCPHAHLLISKGELYWCKSMYWAMKEAIKTEYDFYLMVNDDVLFYDDFWTIMYQTYLAAGCSCGVVGTTQYEQVITYGGRDENNKLIMPSNELKTCYWTNWNCFLIDRKVVELVGIIDNKYQHSYGDYDYAHRMRKRNIPIFVALQCVGECKPNMNSNMIKDNQYTRIKRLKSLFSIKGIPVYSYFRFNYRVYGIRGVFKAIYGYSSLIGYILLNKSI